MVVYYKRPDLPDVPPCGHTRRPCLRQEPLCRKTVRHSPIPRSPPTSIRGNGLCRQGPVSNSSTPFPTPCWSSLRRERSSRSISPFSGPSAGPVTRSSAGGVCEIIHGGRWPHIKCPLEEFLLTREARVEDTRLPGLGGEYSLTIVPVREKDLETRHMLLIARKLTRDEVRKVDTIRTAQLAAIGELAARRCP